MRQSKRRNGGTRRNLFSFTGTCPAPTGVGPTADGEHDAAHAKRAARVTVLTMKSASQREREREREMAMDGGVKGLLQRMRSKFFIQQRSLSVACMACLLGSGSIRFATLM